MERRGLVFSPITDELWGYITADEGWTLSSFELTEPELIENYIYVPGRLDGPLDVSTALTDGDPRYGHRKLTAVLELSSGDIQQRYNEIQNLKRRFSGQRIRINGPDPEYGSHYLLGRVRIEKLYNNLAHAAVRVTATCDPWLYRRTWATKELQSLKQKQSILLINEGLRPVFPKATVEGDSTVSLSGYVIPDVAQFDASKISWVAPLSAGTHTFPEFNIPPQQCLWLQFEGEATIKITYQEADL